MLHTGHYIFTPIKELSQYNCFLANLSSIISQYQWENAALDGGFKIVRLRMPLMVVIIKLLSILGTHKDGRHVNGHQLPTNWHNRVQKRFQFLVIQHHFLQQIQSYQMTIICSTTIWLHHVYIRVEQATVHSHKYIQQLGWWNWQTHQYTYASCLLGAIIADYVTCVTGYNWA